MHTTNGGAPSMAGVQTEYLRREVRGERGPDHESDVTCPNGPIRANQRGRADAQRHSPRNAPRHQQNCYSHAQHGRYTPKIPPPTSDSGSGQLRPYGPITGGAIPRGHSCDPRESLISNPKSIRVITHPPTSSCRVNILLLSAANFRRAPGPPSGVNEPCPPATYTSAAAASSDHESDEGPPTADKVGEKRRAKPATWTSNALAHRRGKQVRTGWGRKHCPPTPLTGSHIRTLQFSPSSTIEAESRPAAVR